MLERGLQVEMTDHLGYDKHDPAGRGSPNSRNGSTPKTLLTEVGQIGIDTPRDRASAGRRCPLHRRNRPVSVLRRRDSSAWTSEMSYPSARVPHDPGHGLLQGQPAAVLVTVMQAPRSPNCRSASPM